MSLEVTALKMHMERTASEHLAQFNNLLENGINGGDQLWVRTGEHRALSALYGVLLSQQLEAFNKEVNSLQQLHKKRQDLSLDKVVSALLYIFRCGELVKLMKNSLVVDQRDPNKIPVPSYWSAMEESLVESEEMVRGIGGNLIFVLTSFAGEDWQQRMPNVIMGFEFYAKFWNANANFK